MFKSESFVQKCVKVMVIYCVIVKKEFCVAFVGPKRLHSFLAALKGHPCICVTFMAIKILMKHPGANDLSFPL